MLLMIDNYDSFTFNLVQYLGELGQEVKVVRNDALSVSDIRALAPERIMISPGPGTPNDAGVSLDVLRHLGGQIPIFGVCLGHQAIGQVYGGMWCVPAGSCTARHRRFAIGGRASSQACQTPLKPPATTRWWWSNLRFRTAWK